MYKFVQLSRAEVETILGLSLEDAIYQEAKAEGEQRGQQDEAINLILRQLTHWLRQNLP